MTNDFPAYEPDSSRREFLRRFTGGMEIDPAEPLTSVLIAGDLYVNHRFGLAFHKPAGWSFQHVKQFAAIRNAYEYATPDPALGAEIRTGPLPIAVISQAARLDTLGCSMTVYVEENPLRPGETLSAAAPDLIRGTSSFVRDFRLLNEPVSTLREGRQQLEFLSGFFYEDNAGNQGPVRNRTLVVLRDTLLYTFHMLDIPADRMDAQAAFDGFRDSILLV